LFTGYTHSKRGPGLTLLPKTAVTQDVCEGINIKREIREIFLHHFIERLRNKAPLIVDEKKEEIIA